MGQPIRLPGLRAAWWMALAASALLGVAPLSRGASQEEQTERLRFAAEMAKKGDWREARFRWTQAAAAEPDNPRILNNLAVAAEVLGEPAKAGELYEKAISLSGGDGRIVDNADRAASFRRIAQSAKDASAGAGAPASKPRKGRGATMELDVRLPLPARLDVSAEKSLLVASFLGQETDLLDTGRELVRFLRTEFHKKTALVVRDVTPAPEVPEQPIDDFIANAEFWKHLGKTYDADLVVSGVVYFTRRDASGFGDVDTISPVTGQKVRRTQFVEQEEFTFDVDLMFFDGRTGALLHRDRLRRTALFRGLSNDPITAFYQMGESLASDVLAVVSPRTRDDRRYVFKD